MERNKLSSLTKIMSYVSYVMLKRNNVKDDIESLTLQSTSQTSVESKFGAREKLHTTYAVSRVTYLMELLQFYIL